MSTDTPLFTELNDGVLKITLNRPKANAFTSEMSRALLKALKNAGRNDEVRVVLLTGAGKLFSAGQDLTEFMQAENLSLREHLQKTYNPLILQLRTLEKPVVAAINGAVAGASLGIALACDLRIAADNARFIVGFLGIGLAPDSAISLLLPQMIGLGRAAEASFGNQPIDAAQALAWGLVNRLAPANELQAQAEAWAAELARGPIRAMGLTKRTFNRAVLPNLADVLDYEAHMQETAGRGAEHKEGVAAFLERRPARFEG